MTQRRPRVWFLAITLALLGACSDASEGDGCDLANGNDDCDEGLICRGAWEVRASGSVCCPAPPAKPSASACQPEVETYEPDPSVDSPPIAPGTGGAGGTGGAAGSGGAAGGDASTGDAADATGDGATDATADGAGD